jgi:hypothetical protein
MSINPNPSRPGVPTTCFGQITGPVPSGAILQLTSNNQMVFPNQNVPLMTGATTFSVPFTPTTVGTATVTGELNYTPTKSQSVLFRVQ